MVEEMEKNNKGSAKSANRRRTPLKVLVTGGAGFLGQYIIEKLLSQGCAVTAIVRRSTNTSALDGEKISLIYGDIRDEAILKQAVAGVDVIVHAAATMKGSWDDFHAINVESTRKLLQLTRGKKLKRFVHISSVSVYDRTGVEDGHVFREDSPYQEKDLIFYSKSKIEAEKVVLEYRKEHNMPTVILRPGPLYGVGGPLYPAQLGVPLGGRRYGLIGDGRSKLSLCHVRSVAEAVWLAIEKERAVGNAYNVVEDESIERLAFLKKVKQSVYPDLNIVKIPYVILRAMSFGFGVLFGLLGKKAPLRPQYLKTASSEVNYATDKIKEELGWQPVADFGSTIDELMTWQRAKERPKRDFPIEKGQVEIPSTDFVNVGIVGCGVISNVHIDILQKIPNVRLIAVSDPSQEAREKFAEKYHIKKRYDSLKSMLDAEDIDVVHILTPAQFHAAPAIEAMNHGCHVLVEKPMALNAAEAAKMVSVAKRKKVKLCVGHNHLFDSVMIAARKVIASGSLGDITYVESWYGVSLSSDRGNRVLAYDARNGWFYQTPGELYQNYISHPVSLLTDVMGEVSAAKSVTTYHRVVPFMNSDELRVLVKNPSMSGMLAISLAVSPRYQFVKVYGTRGTLHVDILNQYYFVDSPSGALPKTIARNLSNFQRGLKLVSVGVGNLVRLVLGKFSLFDGTERMIRLFYRSILMDEPLPVSAEEGLQSMQLMDEIWRQIKPANGTMRSKSMRVTKQRKAKIKVDGQQN